MLSQACFVGCKSHKWVSYQKSLLVLERRLTPVDKRYTQIFEAVGLAGAGHGDPEHRPKEFNISIPREGSESSAVT